MQEHLDELAPEMRAAVERLLGFLADAKIEIIDKTHSKFNGQIFAKNKKGHFYRAVSLHEAVWRFHFGDIPDGYVIHHRNGDKGDNRIENLQLMTAAEHRAWHNQHDKISYRCDYCGKEIEKFHKSRFGNKHFCDVRCWNRYIHANKIYYEERTCVICGKKFSHAHTKRQNLFQSVQTYFSWQNSARTQRYSQSQQLTALRLKVARRKCQNFAYRAEHENQQRNGCA